MFREVSMAEVREVLRLWQMGRGIREIERLLGLNRKTVRRYVTVAAKAGLARGLGGISDEVVGAVVEQLRPGRPLWHGESWTELGREAPKQGSSPPAAAGYQSTAATGGVSLRLGAGNHPIGLCRPTPPSLLDLLVTGEVEDAFARHEDFAVINEADDFTVGEQCPRDEGTPAWLPGNARDPARSSSQADWLEYLALPFDVRHLALSSV